VSTLPTLLSLQARESSEPAPTRSVSGRVRFCLVTNDFPPAVGGIQTYFRSLLEALPPDRVCVVAPARPGSEPVDSRVRFPIVRVASFRGQFLPGRMTLRRLVHAVRDLEPSVIGFGSSMPLGLLAPELSRRLNIPFVMWHHGAELSIAARVPGLGRVLASRLSHASLHFVVSDWTRRVVESFLGKDVPIQVMRYGVDTERFAPSGEGPPPSSHARALSVGRLVRRKGNDAAILALAALHRKGVSVTLDIAGGGPDRKRLEYLARDVGVADLVRFLGVVGDEDLPSLYRSHDFFVAPIRSRLFGLESEGLGITLLEAQASGLPVIAGDSGGTREALVDGETGFMVDGRNETEVARAMERLAGDAGLRKIMGQRGREFVRRHYSREAMVAAFEAGLKRVLAN
jgi:phosphatidylinositol alpha-1,6-mannosyltransferase